MGHCSRCPRELPESRTHTWCKQCLRDYKEQRRCGSNSSAMDTDKTTDDEKQCYDMLAGERDSEEHLDQRTGCDLYVMQNSRLPELKTGRSSNVHARRRSLQCSQDFMINVIAIFPQAGHLETIVHKFLAHCRLSGNVAGREWFSCDPQTAVGAICLALASSLPALSDQQQQPCNARSSGDASEAFG